MDQIFRAGTVGEQTIVVGPFPIHTMVDNTCASWKQRLVPWFSTNATLVKTAMGVMAVLLIWHICVAMTPQPAASGVNDVDLFDCGQLHCEINKWQGTSYLSDKCVTRKKFGTNLLSSLPTDDVRNACVKHHCAEQLRGPVGTVRQLLGMYTVSFTGAWCATLADSYHLDVGLADGIVALVKSDSTSDAHAKVVDLGAGVGRYVSYYRSKGISAQGFDGLPDVDVQTNGLVHHTDLTGQDLSMIPLVPWVICLEVGEHIPVDKTDIFIDNLTSKAERGIILSWGVPGQGGVGHINLRTNSFIIEELIKRGFQYDATVSRDLRSAAQLSWFKNTIMVFRK